MKYMDIKPKSDDRLVEFERWMNATTVKFTTDFGVGRKIEVTVPDTIDNQDWEYVANTQNGKTVMAVF
jgi:hypothetical protein